YRLHWRLGLSTPPHGSLKASVESECTWKYTAGGLPVDFQALSADTTVSLLMAPVPVTFSKSPSAADAWPVQVTLSRIAAPRVPESNVDDGLPAFSSSKPRLVWTRKTRRTMPPPAERMFASAAGYRDATSTETAV